jgi:hypothetical protein
VIDAAVQEIVDDFTGKIVAQLDTNRLDGPVTVDPTRNLVLIPVKGRTPIHVPVRHQINDAGIRNVLYQLSLVPSLQGLVKHR